MQYVVTKGCVIGRQPRAQGDTVESGVDMTDQEERDLAAMGRIAPLGDVPPREDRSVGLTTSKAKALIKRG